MTSGAGSQLRLSSSLAAGSLLFLGVTTIAVSQDTPLQIVDLRAPAVWLWGVAAVASALLVWLTPWGRWRPEFFLGAVALAFLFTLAQGWSTGLYESDFGPAVQAAEFLILSTMVGLTQRRGVPALYALYMLATFLVASLAVEPVRVLTVGAILGTPLCMVQGEIVAWTVTALASARAAAGARVDHLHLLTTSIARLRHDTGPAEAAGTVADLAARLLASPGAVLAVPSDDGIEVAGAGGIELTAKVEAAVRAAWDQPGAPTQVSTADGGNPVLVVPLEADGRSVAVLVATAQEPDGFDAFAVELAQLLASEAAGVLAQLRTIEALSAQSHVDALTEVGNRRHADRLLAGLDTGDAVLLIDLDRLKAVNDGEGHAAGDDLLRALGAFLRASTRDSAAIARYGGDEFVVILHQVDGDPTAVADRLRREWEARSPESTFSVGVAVHDGGPPGATFTKADAALYEAKATAHA